MGMIGRYLDGLTDEQRDRVIRATDWYGYKRHDLRASDAFFSQYVHRGGPDAGCLVSHADGTGLSKAVDDNQPVALRFERLTARFGLPRVVRAIKLRAAKANRVELPEPETAEAVR